MSNIFKFFINNNNAFNKVYIFIKNKYSTSALPIVLTSIPSIEELNKSYNNYDSFLTIRNTYFSDDFSEDEMTYMKTFNSKIIFVN